MKSKKPNRREFLGRSSGLAGAAGVLSASSFEEALGGQAQERAGNAIRRPERFDDSFIFERKPFTWPGGKTLALWIIPNVEVWQFDSPAGAAISPNTANRVPDVINYSWRDYGIRVGLWRIAEVLDAAGVRATVALNARVCDVFPKAVEEMKRRGWEFMGIPLHPFLTGQPWRTPYLKKAIAHFHEHDRVWFATGSEIAEAYQQIQS